MGLPAAWKDYVFIPDAETVRALEMAIVVEAVEFAVTHDVSTVTDWKSWSIALGGAIAVTVVNFIKGRLKPTANSIKAQLRRLQLTPKDPIRIVSLKPTAPTEY